MRYTIERSGALFTVWVHRKHYYQEADYVGTFPSFGQARREAVVTAAIIGDNPDTERGTIADLKKELSDVPF